MAAGTALLQYFAMTTVPSAFGADLRPLFQLEDGPVHLNHGSFGATPRAVLQAQRDWRDRMEAEPSRFMEFDFRPALRSAAARLAPYVGAAADDIALVENPTQAVNAILRSLDLKPGDRILINDQTYGAVRNTVRFVCSMTGAEIAEWTLPFPAEAPEQALAAFDAAVAESRPRVAIIDHVTSPTALALPVAAMTEAARDAGALVLVDGAHAPGMMALDIAGLDADWYTGTCHKWMFAAKGCAFLWAGRRVIDRLHPAVISHGYGSGFHEEFDWVGTRDGSAQQSLPAALDFVDRFGVEAIRTHNHALALAAGRRLAGAWGTEMGQPESMVGSMVMVRLPDGYGSGSETAYDLRMRLLKEDRIQTRINPLAGGLYVRVSSQIYNHIAEIDVLADAVLAKRPNA
ncbi:MAG: aminotransferase class V-fold PLP-dependent enzyme [Thalassobaculaceae bacterium]|nr:aminotransferase class V-fold PLP-dependent enzyme [Thalassobaculaceae bacterium]